MLPNGKYKTKAGSELTISGKYSGIAGLDFDWFEEPGACCDCKAEPYPEQDGQNWYIVWHCDNCGEGRAKLFNN